MLSITQSILSCANGRLAGVFAQLFHAVPVIAISVFLARYVSLESVADFVVLSGISAILLTVSMLGLRTRLIIDQLELFPLASFGFIRIATVFLLFFLIMVSGFLLEISIEICLLLAALRTGDAMLDLALGADQVQRELGSQLHSYFVGSLVKLTLFSGAIATTLFLQINNDFSLFVAAAIVYLTISLILLINACKLKFEFIFSPRNCFSLIRESLVFLWASVICASLTSFPRFALAEITDRQLAGIEAAALSVSTFFGMVFYSIWLRWAGHFGKTGLKKKDIFTFLAENILITIGTVVVSIFILGRICAAIFDIEYSIYGGTVSRVLSWSSIFFATMNIANLFKFSRIAWAESGVYLVGFVSAAILFLVQDQLPTSQLLATSTIGMFFSLLIFCLMAQRKGLGERVI